MKILGVIPSRYASTRFPGKPLAIINGKPMIWWVYTALKQVQELDDIVIATDDQRIYDACRKFSFNVIITKEHANCFYRVHEVSQSLNYDKYLMVNGDEPTIEPEEINKVIAKSREINPYYLFSYRKFTDPVEVIDTGNMKVIVSNNKLLYISRLPIPCPHAKSLFSYKKIVGVQVLSKEALEFFVNSEPGYIEKIEDIAELRWIENKKDIDCIELNSNSISVDNPRDIEKVEFIIKERANDERFNFYNSSSI